MSQLLLATMSTQFSPQLSTNLSTGNTFVAIQSVCLQSILHLLINAEYRSGSPLIHQENSAVCLEILFFNLSIRNKNATLLELHPSLDKQFFQRTHRLIHSDYPLGKTPSTTFHVEPAA
jgi:hypothetical protein